ncbi:flagellar export chaperone FliS [Bacillus sp. AK031]
MDLLTKEFIYQKSSQEITALLYEALLTNIQGAMDDLQKNRLIESNTKLQKSNDILERLGAGLNYEAGIIADQLDALYNYMADVLIKANATKDLTLLDEVRSIAGELSGAWRETLTNKQKNGLHKPNKKTNAYERNVMVYEQESTIVEAGK